MFSEQWTLCGCVTIMQLKISVDLTRTCFCIAYIFENSHKLILIFLSNLFFNSFMKMKTNKWTVFRFPFFIKKIQSKSLLNLKIVVNYLNFVFRIEIKTKSKYNILNFIFQFIKNRKWHFGYTDYNGIVVAHDSIIRFVKSKTMSFK